MKKLALSVLAGLLVAACATTPAYRAAESANESGYSEQVIEADRYRVQYRLASDDVAEARDLAMLRAAELTMEKGFSTFEIVSQTSDTNEKTTADPDTGLQTGRVITRDCGLLTCRTTASPVYTTGTVETVSMRSQTVVTLEILLTNKDASVSPSLYRASEVAANVRSRLE